MKAYELTATPALVDLGRTGKAAVRCSRPFWIGSALHCPNYVHSVDAGRRDFAVFRTHGGSSPGELTVWPSK